MSRTADALQRARLESAGSPAGTGPAAAGERSRLQPFVAEDGRIVSDWAPPAAPVAPAEAEREPPLAPSFELPEPRPRRGAGARAAAALLVVASLAALAYYAVPSSAAGEFTVRRGTVRDVVAGKGKVEPAAEIRVAAKMLGRIKAVYVDEGDEVRKGQLLAVMEADEQRAQVSRARARVQETRARLAEIEAGPRTQEVEATLAQVREAEAVSDEAALAADRQQALFKQGLVPRSQLDEAQKRREVAMAQRHGASERLTLLLSGARPEARAAVRAEVLRAEAELQEAEALLAGAQVVAPISGRILRRFMQPGEVIVLQRPQPIVTLADVSRVLVRTEIDETDLRKVRVGQPAVIRTDAFPGRTFGGRVTEVGPSVGRKTITSEDPSEMMDARVLEAKVELETGTPLTLGLTVDVEIAAAERRDVPIVPRRAVVDRDGRRVLRVKSAAGVLERMVRTGLDDGEHVEIVSGIAPGEVVLIGGRR